MKKTITYFIKFCIRLYLQIEIYFFSIKRFLKQFAEQLKPLVNMEKIDHRRLQSFDDKPQGHFPKTEYS